MDAKVTVLMSVYNEDLSILSKSIDSIINQSYKEFRLLIIIDNPNNIDAISMCESYKEKDPRIEYYINDHNLGLPMALNRGIDLINTEYIARMDADDFSLPNRLKVQIEYLEQHHDVGLIGSNITYIDQLDNVIALRGKIPTHYDDIVKTMKYQNIMSHPTFIGRTVLFQKYRYRNLRYSQDYDFICRLLENEEIVVNTPEYLLNYRVNPNISDDKKIRQKITMYVIRKLYKRHNLQKTDIVNKVEKVLKRTNKKKLLFSMKKYDLSLEKYKNGNRIQALLILLQANVCSKMMMSEFFNTVAYYLIKRKKV